MQPRNAAFTVQVLCGVGEGQSKVHLMFVYRDPDSGEGGYYQKIQLSYKLPVLLEDEL